MKSLKWSFKACLAEAKKYKTRKEWRENSPGSIAAALKKGWYDDCCSHMQLIKPGPEVKWTFEICHSAALNYKTRSEWNDNDRPTYSAASRYGWLEACCQHMGEDKNKQNLKWTLETCIGEAKKYKSFGAWRRMSKGSYRAAERKGWLDECREHLNVDGGWTFEACVEKAKEFKTRTAWQNNCSKSYKVAKKHGWFESCCEHMKAKRGPSPKWTLDECRIEASKYSSRSEWQQRSRASYEFAKMEGRLDECCKHMDTIKKWTFDECLIIAERYKTRTEWETSHPASVGAARKHGWYDDCCKHMGPLRGPSAIIGVTNSLR